VSFFNTNNSYKEIISMRIGNTDYSQEYLNSNPGLEAQIREANKNGVTSDGKTFTNTNASGQTFNTYKYDSAPITNAQQIYDRYTNADGKFTGIPEADTQAMSYVNNLPQNKAFDDSQQNSMQQGTSQPFVNGSANYINQLKEAQKQAQLASLGKARDSSLSNLNAEKAQIQPLYYGMRNKESTGSQLQAKNFAEFLAQRGQSNSGVSGQAELARNVSLQGNIGQLNNAEASAFTENARRVTDTNNAYDSDVASANANIEAQALQNQLSAYQQEQAYAREQANLDRSYNYQVGRDTISDNKSDSLLDYQKTRDAVEDTRYDQNYQQQLEQQKLDNNYRQMQSIIDNEYRQGQITLQERQIKQSEAEFKFQQGQQAIDNAYRQQQTTADNTFREKQLTADTAYKNASLNKSSGGSSGGTNSYTKTEIKDATTQQFDQLLNTDHAMTYEWLNVNEDELIASLGYSGYKSLVDKYQKALSEQAEKGYPKRLINSGGR
jgi:hypothetical protein